MPVIKGLMCITVFTMHGLDFLILTFQDYDTHFQMRKWVGRVYVNFQNPSLIFNPDWLDFQRLCLSAVMQPPLKGNEELVFQKGCFPI